MLQNREKFGSMRRIKLNCQKVMFDISEAARIIIFKEIDEASKIGHKVE